MIYVDCSSPLPERSTYCYICRERGEEGRGGEEEKRRGEGQVKARGKKGRKIHQKERGGWVILTKEGHREGKNK